MTFWKKQNYGNSKKVSSYSFLGGENRQSTEDWGGGSKITLYDITVVDAVSRHFLKPRERTAARVDSNKNCGLPVMITCHCRFIHADKCTSRVRDVENGKGGALDRSWGPVVYGKPWNLSHNCAVNLKLL